MPECGVIEGAGRALGDPSFKFWVSDEETSLASVWGLSTPTNPYEGQVLSRPLWVKEQGPLWGQAPRQALPTPPTLGSRHL